MSFLWTLCSIFTSSGIADTRITHAIPWWVYRQGHCPTSLWDSSFMDSSAECLALDFSMRNLFLAVCTWPKNLHLSTKLSQVTGFAEAPNYQSCITREVKRFLVLPVSVSFNKASGISKILNEAPESNAWKQTEEGSELPSSGVFWCTSYTNSVSLFQDATLWIWIYQNLLSKLLTFNSVFQPFHNLSSHQPFLFLILVSSEFLFTLLGMK